MKLRILSAPRPCLRLPSAIAAMLASLALSPGSARAADQTWDGGAAGTGTAWLTVANWVGDSAVPGAIGTTANGDIANVKAGTGTTVQINMTTASGNFSLGAMDFERTTAGTWNNSTTTSGVLRLNGATVGGVANTLVRLGATGGNLTIANGSGSGTMGLALGNANGIFDVGSGRTLTISSIISHVTSGNGFTKTGTGTLSLGGTNTYNGATIISAGTLSLTNVDALQNSSGLTLGGASAATLTFGADTTGVIIPGAITAANSGVNSTISFGRNTANAGSLSLSGGITGGAGNVIFTTPSANGSNGGQTQTIVLGAAGGYSGNTTITSGGNQFTNTIRAGVANALPATTVLSFTGVAGAGSGRTSTYDLNGNNQELAGLQNTAANDRFQRVTSSAAATLTINNSVAHTFGNFTTGADPGNAQITGAISLAKSNVGTFTLLGSQVYTGATTINAGVLQLGNGGTTGTLTATASITNDGNLTINRSDAFSQATDLGAGVAITGTGSFTQAGAGTTTLTATNTYQGATNVNAGTLVINGSTSSTSLVTVAAAGTLKGSGTINGSLDVSGTLASGTSIESLAVGGNLSFLGGSNFQYELDKDAAANAAGDLTAVAGSLSLAGIVNLSFIETGVGAWELGNPLGDHTGSPAADKLTLISYNGTWNNNLFTYMGGLVQDDSSVTINGQRWWFNYNDTDAGTNFTGDLGGATRFVTITVPEPGAALLGGLGMLGLLRRRR